MKHKKFRLKHLLTTIVFSCLSASTYAASCEVDVFQMYEQIEKYQSVTTIDGQQLTTISFSSESDKHCFARGYHGKFFICPVKWQKGDWGNTLVCTI